MERLGWRRGYAESLAARPGLHWRREVTTIPHGLLFILLGVIAAAMTLRFILFFRGLARSRDKLEGQER